MNCNEESMKKLIKKIILSLDKAQRKKIILVVLITILGSFAELLGVSALLPFIDAILQGDQILNNKYLGAVYSAFQLQNIQQLLVILAIAIIGIYIVKNIYILYMYKVQYYFVYDNRRRVSYRLMKAYLKQPYLYHVSHGSAELIRNIDDDTSMFFTAVSHLLHLLTESTVGVVLIIYLYIRDKSITIGIVVILGLFSILFVKGMKKKSKALGDENRYLFMAVRQNILQAFGGIREVKIMNKEEYYLNSYNEVCKRYSNNYCKNKIIEVMPRPIMEAVTILAMMGVIALKLIKGVDLSYFIPTMTVFVMSAFRMLPSFSRIAISFNALMFNKQAIDTVYEALLRVQELEKQEHIVNKTQDKECLCYEHNIQLCNVTFQYPKGDREILSDVSITINKNESIAFIGPSGQGKTTLADIILGLLPPDKGSVLADGVSIDTHLNQWYKKIGYIPQTIYLTEDTIRNNIAFGLSENEIDEAKVERALRDAQLKDFVSSLPEGLETNIGERGIRLSGGQRQRIGIARALYNNPEILILDEATSALDTETENAVMESINALAGSKTMIVIAHRLTTIRNCDKIYRVEDGNVILVDKEEILRQI